MHERSSKKSKPKDINQLAKSLVDKATDTPPKDPAAVALGRKGGKKGGKARAAKLSAERRSEIAKKAAKTRWAKKKNEDS